MRGEIDLKQEVWNGMRERYQSAKRAKDWATVVNACDEILAFSRDAKELRILDWSFQRDRGNAFEKMGDIPSAVAAYSEALAGCRTYRASEPLSAPSDFLADEQRLQKKIDKLSR